MDTIKPYMGNPFYAPGTLGAKAFYLTQQKLLKRAEIVSNGTASTQPGDSEMTEEVSSPHKLEEFRNMTNHLKQKSSVKENSTPKKQKPIAKLEDNKK